MTKHECWTSTFPFPLAWSFVLVTCFPRALMVNCHLGFRAGRVLGVMAVILRASDLEPQVNADERGRDRDEGMEGWRDRAAGTASGFVSLNPESGFADSPPIPRQGLTTESRRQVWLSNRALAVSLSLEFFHAAGSGQVV